MDILFYFINSNLVFDQQLILLNITHLKLVDQLKSFIFIEKAFILLT